MELFRRTLAGMLMLVVAVSVGIWVQGRFIDAVRLPTHTRMIGATYTTLSDCDVTRSVSKMTEIERRGGKRWDKPKKAGKSRDCRGGKF